MKSEVRISLQLLFVSVVVWVLSLPALASAHPGHVHADSFGAGFMHPLFGLDHVAAMLAVGLWAAQRHGRALWLAPLTFVGVMGLSGILGASGYSLPFIEAGIAVSVLILGVLIFSALRLPVWLSVALIGLFAVYHGIAHGAEIPSTTAGITYGIGFMFATALLHIIGIGVGLLFVRMGAPWVVRFAGGITAALGLCLLAV